MKGVFITFEGTDGAGKTTQIKLLERYLRQQGYEVMVTREPGGTPIGEKIRALILDADNEEMDPVTEMLLYAAARAQHVAQVIKPALYQGKVILCDRFIDSSIAYQGFGRGLGIQLVNTVNRPALRDVLPDLTLFFDIHPLQGLRRCTPRLSKGTDRLESEKLHFHEKVYEGFCFLHRQYSNRIKRIDASLDIDRVFEQVVLEVENLLKLKKEGGRDGETGYCGRSG